MFQTTLTLTAGLRLLAVPILVSASMLGGSPTGAATSTPAAFTIDKVDYATVASDAGAYVDYRLVDNGASNAPICVDSTISPTGSVFSRLNREVADGVRCGDSGGVARNFRIGIETPLACRELAAYGVGLLDSSGLSPWTVGACILNQVDSPRIRIEKVFGKATKTKFAFLVTMFEHPEGHGGFEIQTVTEAPIDAQGTSRVVSYAGQANLVKFATGVGSTKPAPVPGAGFNLKFQMTFTPGSTQ